MERNNKSSFDIKLFLLIIVSVSIGAFASRLFENIEINVWLARALSSLVTVIVALIFHHLWIKKK